MCQMLSHGHFWVSNEVVSTPILLRQNLFLDRHHSSAPKELRNRLQHDGKIMAETIVQWIGFLLAGTGLILILRSDVLFVRHETRRVQAKIVRHHRLRDDGSTMYAAILLLPNGTGGFIEVRDPLYTPFPKPVIGELVEVVHPEGYPEKARIPHPWFRMMMYGILSYAFIMIGLEIV